MKYLTYDVLGTVRRVPDAEPSRLLLRHLRHRQRRARPGLVLDSGRLVQRPERHPQRRAQ